MIQKKKKAKREFYVYRNGKVTLESAGAKKLGATDKGVSRKDKKKLAGWSDKSIPKNQSELFNVLYHSRGGRSEISGKLLFRPGHEFFHWQFEHILPKGRYKRFELYAKNILLCLPEEHVYVTQQTGKARKDPNWEFYFILKENLKTEYHGRKLDD